MKDWGYELIGLHDHPKNLQELAENMNNLFPAMIAFCTYIAIGVMILMFLIILINKIIAIEENGK